jgi:hypothetical protein
MAPPKQPMHGQQCIWSGLSLVFTSLIKQVNKRKTTMLVQPFGQVVKCRCLQSKLDDLLLRPQYQRENSPPTAPTPGPCKPDSLLTDEGPSMLDVLPGMDVDIPPPDLDLPPSTSRWIVPNEKAHNLYKKWGDVIPTLVNPLLSYIASSTGTINQPLLFIQSTCRRISCVRSTSPVLCLFQDHKLRFVYLLSLLISAFLRLHYIRCCNHAYAKVPFKFLLSMASFLLLLDILAWQFQFISWISTMHYLNDCVMQLLRWLMHSTLSTSDAGLFFVTIRYVLSMLSDGFLLIQYNRDSPFMMHFAEV